MEKIKVNYGNEEREREMIEEKKTDVKIMIFDLRTKISEKNLSAYS